MDASGRFAGSDGHAADERAARGDRSDAGFHTVRRHWPALLAACVLLQWHATTGAFEMVAATAANAFVHFDSAAPEGTDVVAITGLGVGESVVGLAYRPLGGNLYALTSAGSLYVVNRITGVATLAFANVAVLSGTKFSMSFNPVVDRLRVVSDSGQNLRINPSTGALVVDVPLNPGSPHVVGLAYTNAYPGATSTSLYDIDSAADMFLQQTNPNGGILAPIGELGVNTGDTASLATLALGSGNVAYATLAVGGTVGLYTIVLETGVAGLVGAVGGNPAIIALAIQPEILFRSGFD